MPVRSHASLGTGRAALFDWFLLRLGWCVLALELFADGLESFAGLLRGLFGSGAGLLGRFLERLTGFDRGLVHLLAGALYRSFGVLVLVTADGQRGEQAHDE